MGENWHALKKEEVYELLDSSEKGLSSKEVENRLKIYGKNELPEKKKVNPIFIFLSQINNLLIYILIIAAIISYFFDHIIDMYVIIFVILLNTSIGFIQEYKAEKAIQALKKMMVSYAKVYRNGELIKIPSSELVPGDVIYLEEGDVIPADALLINIKNLRVNESSFTGESNPVDKVLGVLNKNTSVSDRKNMVFMGTFIASGSCKAIVVLTGSKTEMGKIAEDIQKIPQSPNHFQKKSNFLAKQIAIMALLGSIIIFLVGYFVRDFEFSEMFLFTTATLVSIVPEGLPAVLAIVLAIGAVRMSKRNVLIRKLPATETLGVVTTILTDKTGTLTENTMNVEKIIIPGYDKISVSGNGWDNNGTFSQNDLVINPMQNEQLKLLLEASLICNNANVIKKGQNDYEVIGDPTEAAILILSEKAGMKKNLIEQRKIDDFPFNQKLKLRATLYKKQNSKKILYVIGAPEEIIKKSFHILNRNSKKILSEPIKLKLENEISNLASEGMRTLAIAYKEMPNEINNIDENQFSELTTIGFVGIRDPPRKEVKEAIRKAKSAGIRVIMVTGDHKETAISIARDIGLIEKNENIVFTGEELEKMSEKEFLKSVKNCNVFARLSPRMKLKIASAIQSRGEIVAMTGDGVNDASALKKADIGISMGLIGTDVARESSEMILLDDNFASIINAIEEGRIVFTNARQASAFLVTTNFAGGSTILVSLLAGLPLPLTPIQILWLNLVTSGVTDVSLSAEPGHNDVLNEKPRNAKENILSKEILPFFILIVIVMALATLFIFYSYLNESLEKARTGAFMIMCLTQLFNVLNMRSIKKSVFEIGFFSNKYVTLALIFSLIMLFIVIYLPFLQNIFQFTPLKLPEVVTITTLSSSVFIFGELYKKIKRK
ncbi:MAG: cation-transporting P-type ATPase [Candidatus Pacearchaeota archaeon]